MTEMPFVNNNQVLEKYDNLMVEVGNHLFEAECLLTSFIKEILIANDNKLNIEIELADQGEYFFNITIESIYWNDDKRCLEIQGMNGNDKQILEWDRLPISTKTLIANFIHLNMLSDEIYNNLN